MIFRPPIGSTRSPYGITEPPARPPVLPGKPNWLQSLLKYKQVLIPNSQRDRQNALQWAGEATTQPRLPSSYDTRVNAFQNSGLSSMEPYGLLEASSDTRWPWPVGTPFGPPSNPRGRDYVPRPGFPGDRRPVFGAETSHYRALHSANDRQRSGWFPISGGRPSYGLDFGPAPWRVPFIRKSGLQLMAGPAQQSTQQWYSGVAGVAGPSGGILIAPPSWSDYTRGLRSLSGVLGRVQGPGRNRVPAVFVPREVR